MPRQSKTRPSARNDQQFIPGLGRLHITPKKSRRGPQYMERYESLGGAQRLRDAQSMLDAALNAMFPSDDEGGEDVQGQTDVNPFIEDASAMIASPATPSRPPPIPQLQLESQANTPHNLPVHPSHEPMGMLMDMPDFAIPPPPSPPPSPTNHHNLESWVREHGGKKRRKRKAKKQDPEEMHKRWREVIARMVDPLLEYERNAAGKHAATEKDIDWMPPLCRNSGGCERRTHVVMCLFWDHFAYVDVSACHCRSLPVQLVAKGLFPTSPIEPRMAVSIEVLNFISRLLHHSGDAITSIAEAIHRFYHLRGWHVVNSKGKVVNDPFRKRLSTAITWYDKLQCEVEIAVEAYLVECVDMMESYEQAKHAQERHDPNCGAATAPQGDAHESHSCSRALQARCPACFGGDVFGRPMRSDRGADIHVAVDGNFHQRHRKSAGDVPSSYEPKYFISKQFVDEVGEHIESVRKRPPRPRKKDSLSDEAVAICEKSHAAADGAKAKANGDVFDDTGLMALVCRHGIPLFLANIDTPGEQQKYAVALLKHLFDQIPPSATVCALYDVGCTLERSLDIYPILPDAVTSRLIFATPAMHAWAHEWACQLFFNCRLLKGMALTDGEATERFWARIRGLIPQTRASARSRRIWLLDRKAADIHTEIRSELGNWIKRKLKHGVEKQGLVAQGDFLTSGMSDAYLHEQWEAQRVTQKSKRSHAPARMKKDLNAVIDLQSQIEGISRFVSTTRHELSPGIVTPQTGQIIQRLEQQHRDLLAQCDALYQSLNVTQHLPNYQGLPLQFVETLFLARDLKISVRARAVDSFFEWERLDQAAGGRNRPLGTKAHQRTRDAITRRKPALMNAIRKYNKYCDALATMKQPNWNIPIPKPLPTDLALLKQDPDLLEEVWISPYETAMQDAPIWVTDERVRKGIRAVVKLDRCAEERRRLGMEADNMVRWFGEELGVLDLATRFARGTLYEHRIQRIRSEHLLNATRWVTPLSSELQFEEKITRAWTSAEQAFIRTDIPRPIRWLPPAPHSGNDVEDAFKSAGATMYRFDTPNDDFGDDEEDPEEDDVAGDVENDERDAGDEGFEDNNDGSDVDEDLLEALSLGDRPLEDSELTNAATLECTRDFQNDDEQVDDFKDIRQAHVLPAWLTLIHGVAKHPDRLLPSDFAGGRRRRVTFEAEDLRKLIPGKQLNDICVNGLARILQATLPRGSKYALFLTYCLVNLPEVEDRSAVVSFVRGLQYSGYRERAQWIVPIHQKERHHWTLAVVDLPAREILHFDSMYGRRSMERDVEVVFKFVKVVCSGSEIPYGGSWKGRSLLLTPRMLQKNFDDCGVWVLAAMASLMRGKLSVGLDSADIPIFRGYLLRLIDKLDVQ